MVSPLPRPASLTHQHTDTHTPDLPVDPWVLLHNSPLNHLQRCFLLHLLILSIHYLSHLPSLIFCNFFLLKQFSHFKCNLSISAYRVFFHIILSLYHSCSAHFLSHSANPGGDANSPLLSQESARWHMQDSANIKKGSVKCLNKTMACACKTYFIDFYASIKQL